MLFRSSTSQTNKHVKIWLAGGEIFFRELTQQAGKKGRDFLLRHRDAPIL